MPSSHFFFFRPFLTFAEPGYAYCGVQNVVVSILFLVSYLKTSFFASFIRISRRNHIVSFTSEYPLSGTLESNQIKLMTELVLVIHDTANFVVGVFSKFVRQLSSFLEILGITLVVGFQFRDMKRIVNLDVRRQRQRKIIRTGSLNHQVRSKPQWI